MLVVDDDAGIRQMLSIALAEAGHEVRLEDGRGPIDAGDADVLVLDLRLGDRSAQDLLAEQPLLRELPTVLMTAAGSTEAAIRGVPARSVLAKPFDLDALEDAIRSAAGSRGAPGRSPQAPAGIGSDGDA